MKILIVGAGSVGCYFGSLLALQGHHVTFGTRSEPVKLRAEGLRVEGPRGNWTIEPARATAIATEVDAPDVALICVKLYATASAVAQWKPALSQAGAIVSLQNGMDGIQRLAEAWPCDGDGDGDGNRERDRDHDDGSHDESRVPMPPTFAGLALMSGTMLSANHLRYTSDMSAIQFGGPTAGRTPVLEELSAACEAAGFSGTCVADVASAQWKKFIALATNAAMTSLTRKPAGVCFHEPELIALARRSIGEVVRVARAEGAVLADSAEQDALRMLQAFPPGMFASMYHDLIAERPLEVDGLSGHVVRTGRKHGIDTPFHQTAWACLMPHALGKEKIMNAPMNLADTRPADTRPVDMSDAEWQARQDLACAYRLFDHFGWHELIFNHITVRVPDEDGHFLINPFGLMYREIKASNLVKIDLDGRVLSSPPSLINPAGFIVHAAVHAGRHDAHAVIHTHTTAGQAVSCQAQGLLPLSFSSVFFHERIAYHEFEGITLDRDECGRLATSLGQSNVMILRNHGLLTCGPTLAHAFSLHYQLQRACEVQIAAQAGGATLLPVRDAVASRAAGQFAAAQVGGGQDEMMFDAMRRWMVDKDPSFMA